MLDTVVLLCTGYSPILCTENNTTVYWVQGTVLLRTGYSAPVSEDSTHCYYCIYFTLIAGSTFQTMKIRHGHKNSMYELMAQIILKLLI